MDTTVGAGEGIRMTPLRRTLACAGFHRVQTVSPPVMTSTSESVAIAIKLRRVTTLAPDRPYSGLAGTLGLEAGEDAAAVAEDSRESSSGPRRKRTCHPYRCAARSCCTGPPRRQVADAQHSCIRALSSYLRLFSRRIGLLLPLFEPSEVPSMRTKAN